MKRQTGRQRIREKKGRGFNWFLEKKKGMSECELEGLLTKIVFSNCEQHLEIA